MHSCQWRLIVANSTNNPPHLALRPLLGGHHRAKIEEMGMLYFAPTHPNILSSVLLQFAS